jgi:hypothetical protein
LERVGAIVGESAASADSEGRKRFFAGLREQFALVPEHPEHDEISMFSGLRPEAPSAE